MKIYLVIYVSVQENHFRIESITRGFDGAMRYIAEESSFSHDDYRVFETSLGADMSITCDKNGLHVKGEIKRISFLLANQTTEE